MVEPLYADAVFESGGVRGIGLVGALSVIEQRYALQNVAGTSAGAVVAALAAAGYTAAELRQIMLAQDLHTFTDGGLLDAVPGLDAITHAIDILFQLGMYKGDTFLHFMEKKLAAKNVHTFRDLHYRGYREGVDDAKYKYRLRVVASDITQGRMLVLPEDIAGYREFHGNPDELPVALAVRMSMSIPLFFKPVRLTNRAGQSCVIVDGGILSNFPVWLFDSDGEPAWPTFGFRLVAGDATQGKPPPVQHRIEGPLSEVVAIFDSAMNALDAYYIKKDNFVRTIAIDTLGVNPRDFTLTNATKTRLYKSGVTAAEQFLSTWDFERYKQRYRSGRPLRSRHELLLPKP